MPNFDYSSIPSINAKLRASRSQGSNISNGPKKAMYLQTNGMDALVDNSGNLHLINVIASGALNHIDSLEFNFARSDGISFIYDTYTTTNGWNALLIDSLQSVPANIYSPFKDKTGSILDVDARIQASISSDGSHIFYMWMDTYQTQAGVQQENYAPEIFGKGWNLTTGKSTAKKDFTADGGNYFMYTSNVALVNGNTYTIPTTISLTRGTYITDDPFDHYYVSGIEFAESEFNIATPVGGTIGISESYMNSDISQNYPNPFNNLTYIDITLNEASDVHIEVMNTVGQNVLIQNAGKLTAGSHTLSIDGSKLPGGIYFYTIITSNNSVTQKMIVQ
jgi:hypothetical protein